MENGQQGTLAPELLEPMKRIQELAPAFNVRRDEIDSTITCVEKLLDDCKVGIRAWVEVDGLGKLIYGRVCGKFRIAIRTPDGDAPWQEHPSWTKAETLKHLPALIRAIAENLERAAKDD